MSEEREPRPETEELASRQSQSLNPATPSQDVEKQSPPASHTASNGHTAASNEHSTRNPDRDSPRNYNDSKYDPDYQVSWDGPNDPTFPQNFPIWKKWVIVAITSSTALCVTCTSSLYTSTYEQLEEEFNCSRIVATLGLSLFVVGLGLSPMVLGPFSEFYGRRPIYVISMALFTIWIVPCAVAQNIQTELVARFFDGFAGAAFLSVAGGTVGDLFDKMSLQAPMLIFTSSPFLGPVLGPILGGFINQFANWRWSFWTLLIWSAVQWLLVFFFVPETYHPVLLRDKARKLRKETGDERWHAHIEILERSKTMTVVRSCYRPFLLLTLEPMVLNLCLLSSLLLGILYLFFGAFALIFRNNHGFSPYQVGLSFSGIGLGMLLAISTDPFWHRYYQRLVATRRAQDPSLPANEPEFRLPPAVIGAPIVALGLFIFSWTTLPSVHWIVPLLASVVFGCGTILVFSGVFTFLVDAYPLYAASALAANSFARSSFAAAFPLFGVQMYEKLGYQWASTLLAFLALAMAPFPFLFYRYGKRIRRYSKFAGASK